MHERTSVIAFNSPGLNDDLYADIPPENKATFRDGPHYFCFRSSDPKQHVFRFRGRELFHFQRKDPITNTTAGDSAAIEVIELPTGCEGDTLCHGIGHFE